jgi:Protein of unknown function (DUF2970)
VSEHKEDVLMRKASLGSTVKAVASSFFGVRASKSHQEDVAKLNPVVVIGVGIGMAILFILTLVTVVKLVLR